VLSAVLGYLINQLPGIQSWSVAARVTLFLTVVAASSIVAAATSAATENEMSTPVPTVSTSARPLSLSEYVAKWRAGPVKLTVEHYNAWVVRKNSKDVKDWTEFDMRFSVRNETTGPLDLAEAPASLVLVRNAVYPADSTFTDNQRSIAEVPADWNLYGVGFDNVPDYVSVGDKKYDIFWTGSTLKVADEFTSASTAGNGISYQMPAPARALKGEVDAVAPSAVNVIGAAWLGTDGLIQGFTPTSEWKGPNSIDSFIEG
jgi:hypothetical protein